MQFIYLFNKIDWYYHNCKCQVHFFPSNLIPDPFIELIQSLPFDLNEHRNMLPTIPILSNSS